MYNPKSSKAEEFIAHEEVLASLEYGEKTRAMWKRLTAS